MRGMARIALSMTVAVGSPTPPPGSGNRTPAQITQCAELRNQFPALFFQRS